MNDPGFQPHTSKTRNGPVQGYPACIGVEEGPLEHRLVPVSGLGSRGRSDGGRC